VVPLYVVLELGDLRLAVGKRDKHDIPRHVRSEDVPERQKADSVHKPSDHRHSGQGVWYDFFSGGTVRHG
jgi:hypothetical protein